jgi:hypothetical protein
MLRFKFYKIFTNLTSTESQEHYLIYMIIVYLVMEPKTLQREVVVVYSHLSLAYQLILQVLLVLATQSF